MKEDIKTIEHIIEEYKKLDIIHNSKTPCSEITALQNLIARYKELEEKNKKVMKFCKNKSTFQTFGDEEMQYVLETYINRLKHRIIDILED